MVNEKIELSAMDRRSFLTKSVLGGGGLLAAAGVLRAQASAVSSAEASRAMPLQDDPPPCPAPGPAGQIINPHTKDLNLLPHGRLSWEGLGARLSTQDGVCCLRATAADLALRHPECNIEDIVNIDPTTTFQKILGFGGTITDSDASNLLRLSPEKRRVAIAALVGPEGLHFNLMRIAFGSSDWNRDWDFYTYDDVPAGASDPQLSHFSIQRDIDRGLIGVLKEFLAVNPDLRLLASVWGVPAWMTTTRSLMHGCFDSNCIQPYAEYLIKSIQAYADAGVPIHYLAIQNEPGTAGDRNTPAAMWTWEQQRDVLLAVGDRLKLSRLTTKLWLLDHNFDMAQTVAKPLLDDPRVKQLADHVAFHDYRGRPEEMALLLRQHPEVPAVVSERNRATIAELSRLVDCLNNGASGHISWTTVSDEWGGPYQWEGGSGKGPAPVIYENVGRIMVVPQAGRLIEAHRTLVYYGYQTFAPLIQRGASRIAASPLAYPETATAAFLNPDNSIVVVLVNNREEGIDLAIQRGRAALPLRLPGRGILSLVFAS